MSDDNKDVSILRKFALLISELHRLSPSHWVPLLIRKLFGYSPSNLSQNTTDAYVSIRLCAGVLLVFVVPVGYTSAIVASVLLLEMTIAYFAHYMSDKYNSAGPGKVTSVRRTILILTINYGTFILLFAVLFQRFNQLSPVDAVYLSTITISTLGYGDVVPKNSIAKLLACVEVTVGLLQIAIYFGAVSGWSAIRRERKSK